MAAYAALVSVMHIIDTIEHHHSPPISIHKQQVESLTQILTSLQEFLEGYKSPVADGDEADPLEMRIVDAAHAVEDVIESHIVDKLQPRRSKRIADAAYAAEDAIESHIVDKLQPRRSKRIANAAYAAEDAIESHIVDKLQPRRSKRIANAAYAAEDAIESHIVDKLQLRRSKKAKIDTAEADEQINFYQDRLQQVIEEMNVIKKEAMENELGRSMSPNEKFFEGCDTSSDYSDEADAVGKEVSCIDFYEDLQRVIDEMNVIKKEAKKIAAEAQLRKLSLTHAGSLTSSSNVKESMMVGFDDVQLQLLDWLTGGNRNRQIIPITGMGGIARTCSRRRRWHLRPANESLPFPSAISPSRRQPSFKFVILVYNLILAKLHIDQSARTCSRRRRWHLRSANESLPFPSAVSPSRCQPSRALYVAFQSVIKGCESLCIQCKTI